MPIMAANEDLNAILARLDDLTRRVERLEDTALTRDQMTAALRETISRNVSTDDGPST